MVQGVQFDEPGMDYARRVQHRSGASAIIGAIIKAGFAKNEQQAQIVLVVIALFAVGVAYMFWPSGSNSAINAQPLYADPALEAVRLQGQ